MKKGSTLFLKGVVLLIGIAVLALCVFLLFVIVKKPVNPEYVSLLYPVLTGMYLSAIPFFVALYQAFRLLSYIDKNTAFSNLSVVALKKIKYCAASISILYGLCMPFLYMIAEKDDAPGIIVFGLVFVFASFVIATFAAVLQRLLQEAIDIKSENDLTV